MKRQTVKLTMFLVTLTAIAAFAQGCADRRYAGPGQPSRTVVQTVQPAAPAPQVQTAPVQQARVAEPPKVMRVRPVPPTPTPSRVTVVQRPAAVTSAVPETSASSASGLPAKQALTSPTLAERVIAPTGTATATQVQEEESQQTIIVRRDSSGRRLVAATNTSTPVGTLGGRPVFAVDDVPDDVAQELEEYRLGPSDRLQIKVFGQDEISGEFEVSAAGELSFPLIGQITAENLTPGEFNEFLTEALKEFFVNPQVTVEVTNYRPFFILGQVGNPGSYKYQPGLNARMAIAVGGGYTRRAKEEPITIFRTDSAGNLIKFDAAQDSIILPGDTIEVHRRLF